MLENAGVEEVTPGVRQVVPELVRLDLKGARTAKMPIDLIDVDLPRAALCRLLRRFRRCALRGGRTEFVELRLRSLQALLKVADDHPKIVADRLDLIAEFQKAREILGLCFLFLLDPRDRLAGGFEFVQVFRRDGLRMKRGAGQGEDPAKKSQQDEKITTHRGHFPEGQSGTDRLCIIVRAIQGGKVFHKGRPQPELQVQHEFRSVTRSCHSASGHMGWHRAAARSLSTPRSLTAQGALVCSDL